MVARLLLAAPAAPAQPAPATLETTVVTATRSERAALDVPASVDVIERSEVRDAQWRINLSESLARVPGVVALNRQNDAQDLQISIRGFGARSTFGVRGVRLYLDGIPASQPDGPGQVSNFPLDAVDRIEVLRGPFSALYGNSSGGVIAMTTRVGPSVPTAEVSGAAGGYGTWRSGLSLAGGNDAASASFDASRFSTEGYREHSQATREVVNLRAAARTPVGQLRVSVNGLGPRTTSSSWPTWAGGPRSATRQRHGAMASRRASAGGRRRAWPCRPRWPPCARRTRSRSRRAWQRPARDRRRSCPLATGCRACQRKLYSSAPITGLAASTSGPSGVHSRACRSMTATRTLPPDGA